MAHRAFGRRSAQACWPCWRECGTWCTQTPASSVGRLADKPRPAAARAVVAAPTWPSIAPSTTHRHNRIAILISLLRAPPIMNPPRAPLQLHTSCAASLVNSSPSRLVPLRVHHAATPFAICPLPWAVGLSLGCLRWAGGEATIARRRDVDRGERRQRVSISAMAIKC